MRIAVTGMGGELGTRVARLLDSDDRVAELLGLDVEPPRRHLRRAQFHRIDPSDRERTVAVLAEFAPTVLVHLGVYEPYARVEPALAISRTAIGTIAALDGCLRGGQLESVVVRSGIEVYGRAKNRPVRPDETVRPDPTSPFGESMLHVERVARDGARRVDAPVALLRLAPVVGPHVPSPLGRVLRLPAVPVPATGAPRFCVLHPEDAAAAVVAAVHRRTDGPVNVVGPGAVTPRQAARLGRRVPVPTWGPGWRVASATTSLAGAPMPEHVVELLVRGRLADGAMAGEALGIAPRHTTPEVLGHLHEWAPPTWVIDDSGHPAA
ncbi:MAG TPA: NAD-dependent epimerase/dehydratase family protein [Acidimicrobiales bacterium]